METSLAASSSTLSPSVLPTGDYEVFMSFRGSEVRNGFADHLYTSLARAKIRTFRDEEELQTGERIASSLVRAIPESKIHIAILSERYASSKWCLLELAQMVKCWKQGKGHRILPIFYFVDPRDVRKQQGSYQQAFEQHAQKHSPQTVMEWKEALREVGQMKGWHVTESRGEGSIVDEVLSKVESHLRSMYTLVTDELVGINTPVKEVMELLNLGLSNEKVIVGIHGMGGLGKTTLAQVVYNKICAQFDRCCFLDDAREALAKSNGAVSLQNKVISTILKGDYQVRSFSEGINVIKDRVCKHKLLLIVDDIDDKFEFDKILGKLGDFSSGSRFIFTTRYKRALDFIPDCKLYEPREMTPHLSLQLFSKHAFGMDNPPEEDAGISEKFVKVATGLPLALKVIGSLLFHRARRFWEEKLIELQEIASTTENKLQEKLKISYNDLSFNEKQIFLDISCFFISSRKNVPYYFWSDSGFYPESGITTLIDRFLMKLDEKDEFWMHDHIRDLGRAIVKEEDVEHPYKRSRIWSTEDALDMLRNGEGSKLVKIVRIDNTGYGDDIDMHLDNKNFEKLSGLRYLEVRQIGLKGDFSKALPNIRCLILSNCPSIPADVNMKKLVVFNLAFSDVKDDWKCWSGIKAAGKLKSVNLLDCRKLTKSPDLSTCTSLEILRIRFTPLTDIVPESGDIGNHQRLTVMDLDWTELSELPAGMGNLSSLRVLNLRKWKGWKTKIPKLPKSLKSLSISSLIGVPNLLDLKELESLSYYGPLNLGDLWRLSKLKKLTLERSPNISTLLQQEQDREATSPADALPTSLISLEVVDCPDLNELPSLANLCNLTRLKLSGIGVVEIQGLCELRALETMEISSSKLTNLDGLENLILIKTMRLCYAKLERLPSLANRSKLMALEVAHCPNLVEIQGHANLSKLKKLEVCDCPHLVEIQGLANLSKLMFLEVCDCPNLVEIQGLGCLGESLSSLTIKKCPGLGNLDGLQFLGALEGLTLYEQSFGGLDLSGLVNLKFLDIERCTELTEVTGMGRLVSLVKLTMTSCTSIQQLSHLSELINLKLLTLCDCRSLMNVFGVEGLELLLWLKLSGCGSIRKLPNLSGLKNLGRLDLGGCIELTELEGVEGLNSLLWLHLSGCGSIRKLPNLFGLQKLKTLNLGGCIELTEVEGVEGLESLRELNLRDCRSITHLGNLSGLKKLEELDILGCTKLIEVHGLDELTELKDLKMERMMMRRMRVKWWVKSAARYAMGLCFFLIEICQGNSLHRST